MSYSVSESGRINAIFCHFTPSLRKLVICILILFSVLSIPVFGDGGIPDDLHEMTCGHKKAPRQVWISTKPESHIFILKDGKPWYIGSSGNPVILECCRCSPTFYFAKTADPVEAEQELRIGSRTGYKNNQAPVEQGYFTTRDRWPENGPYTLEGYTALENAVLFLRQHWISLVVLSSIALMMGIITGIRLKKKKRFIEMALMRADDAGLVSRAEMTIAVGELGDLRGKSLKGQFGTYQLKGLLGEGGMSMVYEGWRALDDNTTYDTVHETYAIKIMLPSVTKDHEFNRRFKREISVYLKLKHPGIVQLNDWGEDPVEGVFFMVLEKVSGRSLASVIKSDFITVPQASFYMLQAFDAIDFAHRHDVVHRDIKPQNMFVTGKDNIKILDFGIARQLDTMGITATDVVLGTPQYLPPEQLDAKTVDGRADLYSLGVVFYEMVCKVLPFSGVSTMEIITKQVTQKPPRPSSHNPEIPLSIEKVILRLLEKKPANRYSSAKEARDALNEALNEAGIELPQ